LPLPGALFEMEMDHNQLLETEPLAGKLLSPKIGEKMLWLDGTTAVWRMNSDPEVEPSPTVKALSISYCAVYITTARRQTVEFKAETTFPSVLYLEGEREAKVSDYAVADAPNLLRAEVDLHTGKHLLLLKILKTRPAKEEKCLINITICPQEGFGIETLKADIDPQKTFTDYKYIAHLLGIYETTISPDGKLVAFSRAQRDHTTFKRHQWIEIYSLSDGKLLRQIEFGNNISAPRFSGDNRSLYFQTGSDNGTLIYRYFIESGKTEKVLGPISGLVNIKLSPDEKFAYYTVDGEREKKGTDDYTMLETLEDRLTDWSDARKLYVTSLSEGITYPLTSVGEFAVDEFALSPDGNRIIFTRRIAITGRPFFDTEFWLYNIPSGEARLVTTQKIPFETRPLNLTLLPDNKTLLFTSSNYFSDQDTAGTHSLSEDDIWMCDLNTGQMRNLIGDTQFTVNEGGGTFNAMFYNPKDKRLYFPAFTKGFSKIYSLDVKNPQDIKELPFDNIYIYNLNFSADGKRCVYIDSQLDRPNEVYSYDLEKKQARLLINPNEDLTKEFKIGAYERWDFIDSKGFTIDGWLIYPPDFDKAKKYPLIVYYYAGVSQLDEGFYYPYHFFAANGYVVYALTPVGAIAHGDKFADYHANDWGTNATQDIIEGVQKLVKDKPFIDRAKMGCYGASYGGFTTMDLVTKTDMFAGAVAMYGISDIASYWGGGTWGYTYGDIALPTSFPWNRPDIFAGKSPLYHADKVKTPLLLLHGISDVNVPELESEQMFTALRVQGKEVALVKFPNEDHGIAGKYTNYLAHREMMLEWFDKYLKGEPEGWERRWQDKR
jgi:dipeptidyl aminopeptidase/acylaminoacyl peptidase